MFAIADAHNDFLTNKLCNLENFNNNLKKNNVTLCNAILFSNSNDFNIKKAQKLREHTLKFDNLKQRCIFSFENLLFLKENEYDNLIAFHPFSCSLTWNYDNQFAGGALDYGGLKQKGKELIYLLNQNNIIIDVAHLNRKSFWDIIRVTHKPLFNSHTCFNIYEHRRSIDIEQTKAIIDSNGFIGITFVTEFLSNKQKISSKLVFENIDVIIQNFGINNIGIGSDFFGTTKLPYDLKYYDNFKNLYKHFHLNGYKDDDIKKIFADNFTNFVKTNSNYL